MCREECGRLSSTVRPWIAPSTAVDGARNGQVGIMLHRGPRESQDLWTAMPPTLGAGPPLARVFAEGRDVEGAGGQTWDQPATSSCRPALQSTFHPSSAALSCTQSARSDGDAPSQLEGRWPCREKSPLHRKAGAHRVSSNATPPIVIGRKSAFDQDLAIQIWSRPHRASRILT